MDPTQGCVECRGERFAFDRVIRLGVYDKELRQACIRSKSLGSAPLAAALADLLWEQERAAFVSAGVDVVVPVPQFWLQRLTRPHHSALTLARVLAARLNVELGTHILWKVRWTQDQSNLNAQQRRQNLRQAFRVSRGSRLSDATVLLVDDILTTRTTANESARALRQGGAKRVVAAVIAAVP